MNSAATLQPERAPHAGPLCHATLIVRQLEPVAQAYRALGLSPTAEPMSVDPAQAQAWGHPMLQNCRQQMLATQAQGGAAAPLLRLIEHPNARPRPTRFSQGWLALEILVRDVDALAAHLSAAQASATGAITGVRTCVASDDSSPGFDIVGPPADLDVSPAIRAMQLVGPAGEMLYLTQVKAPVPPFDIPLSSSLAPSSPALGPLFIAVLSTPSRSATLAACAPLRPRQILQFDTKITVLNRALGHDITRRWPVATAQWAGASLFEIDEVADPQVTAAPLATDALPCGLAWVTMVVPAALSATLPPGRLFAVSPGAWVETVAG